MNNKIKEYRIFYAEKNLIKDNGTRFGTLKMLQNDFPGENWGLSLSRKYRIIGRR